MQQANRMEEGQPRSDVACHSQARCVRNQLFVAVEHRIEITPLAQLEYKTEGPVLIRMPTLLLESHLREKASLPFLFHLTGLHSQSLKSVQKTCAYLLVRIGLCRECGNGGFESDNIGVARREKAQGFHFQIDLPEDDMHWLKFHRDGAELLHRLHVFDCNLHFLLQAYRRSASAGGRGNAIPANAALCRSAPARRAPQRWHGQCCQRRLRRS